MDTRLLAKCDRPLKRGTVALTFALDRGLIVRLPLAIAFIAVAWWLARKFIEN